MKKFTGRVTAIAAVTALTAACFSTTAFAYGEMDVSSSTFKSDTDSSTSFQTWRDTIWQNEKSDSGKVALTPGSTEKDLNFAWYSQVKGTPAVKVWKDGQKSSAKVFEGTAEDISAKNWQGNVYTAGNKVSITDYFEENTTYYYQYTDNDTGDDAVWSEAYSYKTGNTDDFSVILTGDPQIGASGSSDDYTPDDSSAARDTYNWNLTMQQALKTDSDAVFLLSAGDQINQSGAAKDDDKKTRESEYAGYLYPSVLRSLPVASTIGNHDTAGADYSVHFNNPNAEDNLGATEAGSDYYFSYGDVLFISLNSNNRNQEEHRALMTKAVESNPDAKWKVVIFHSDIYGSGQPHADTDAATSRIIFAPLMDEFDIDVCLTGHDHTYSRSYQIQDGNVIDYDISDGSVTDPEGTLYITTGSGSGSKYYNLLNYTPYYIAERTNDCLPAFSTIDFTADSFTIQTFDYNGNTYADSFTIKKSAGVLSVDETIANAEKTLAGMDTSVYTADSVTRLKNALAALKEVKAKYATAEDTAISVISQAYGTEEDPIKGYGSVKNEENKDDTYDTYGNTKENGKHANRLRKGYSTLLDKTIYLQLDGDDKTEVPVVQAAEILAAKSAVNTAVDSLEKVEEKNDKTEETTTEDESREESTKESTGNKENQSTEGVQETTSAKSSETAADKQQTTTAAKNAEIVKTGDNTSRTAAAAVAGMTIALGAVLLVTGKREENCETK